MLENGGWQSLSITEQTTELAEAMAKEGNLRTIESTFWIWQVIISGLGEHEIPFMCSDLIYVGVVERKLGRILVVYNISYILANKVWRFITIRQIRETLVPPNFRRLWYYNL